MLQLSNGPEPRTMPERRARILSGLPRPVDRTRPWWRRALTNPWVWLGLLVVVGYVWGLYSMYHLLTQSTKVDATHEVPGLNREALEEGAGLAARTAVVWALVWLMVDRFRRLPLWMYLAALGWGASTATLVSLHLNDFFGALMMVRGAGSPGAGARAAVFSAPFVEETCKGTAVFLLAILVRNRISSILQSVTLAAMTAIGFAFTENIVYYARARVYASYTQQAGDADAAVRQLFHMRGIYTSFGHMLFTSMTGIGIGVALRTRSKLVRILAPLTGFCVAATMHMGFNGISSTLSSGSQELQFYALGWGLVAALASFLVGHTLRERARVRRRLSDFVRMGWLNEDDPETYSSILRRAWLLIVAARRGRTTWRATRRFMCDITELAYTRDAMVRGVIGEAGTEYNRRLLGDIEALRPVALTNTTGLRLAIPWKRALFWRNRRGQLAASPAWAAPAGAPMSTTQQWPAPQWPTRS